MNPCAFKIQPYSFTPSKKVVTLEERKEKFKLKLKNWASYNDLEKKEYPAWLRKEFFSYWVEFANDNGRKMRFEMEKTWNTGRRLATAKRTIYAKDPRWKQNETMKVKINTTKGEYSEVNYEAAKERLQNEPKQVGNIGSKIRKRLS